MREHSGFVAVPLRDARRYIGKDPGVSGWRQDSAGRSLSEFVSTLAIAATGESSWWRGDWWPSRGLFNACRPVPLPEALATHPVVSRALVDIDRAQVRECHGKIGVKYNVDMSAWRMN